MVIVWLVRQTSVLWAYTDLTTISPQPVLYPPLTPPQTTVHRPLERGQQCPSQVIAAWPRFSAFNYLFCPQFSAISRCVTGLWSPSSVLCRTEFDTPVFREQSYVSSKCVRMLKLSKYVVFYYFIRYFLTPKIFIFFSSQKKK